jgi:hypothetical protein
LPPPSGTPGSWAVPPLRVERSHSKERENREVLSLG